MTSADRQALSIAAGKTLMESITLASNVNKFNNAFFLYWKEKIISDDDTTLTLDKLVEYNKNFTDFISSMRTLNEAAASAAGSLEAIAALDIPGAFQTLVQSVNDNMDSVPNTSMLDNLLNMIELKHLEIEKINELSKEEEDKAKVAEDIAAILKAGKQTTITDEQKIKIKNDMKNLQDDSLQTDATNEAMSTFNT